MKICRWTYVAASAVVVVLVAMNAAQAVVVFSETFETPAVGAAINTTNSVFTAGMSGGTFTVRDDINPLVPAGNTNPFTGTKYMDYNDAASRATLNAPAAISDTTFKLSFDYFEPTVALALQANTTFAFTSGLMGGTNNGNRAFQINFSVLDGLKGTISVQGGEADSSGPTQTVVDAFNANELVHVDIVGNMLSTPVNYNFGGIQSLSASTIDVYLNGVRFIDDGPFRHATVTNVTHVGISPPGGGSQTQRAYFDNIVLEKDFLGAPVQLTADRDTGHLILTNPTGLLGALDIIGYSIISNSGALDQTAWKSVANNYDAGQIDPFDADSQWTILSASGTHADLSEVTFSGNGGDLDAAESLVLSQGSGAWIPTPTEDLVVELLLADGSTRNVSVLYTGNNGNALLRSDLDTDGDVDGNDFVLYNAGLFTTIPANSAALAYLQGDLNGDGVNNENDFLLFKTDYIAANGAPAFASLTGGAIVPEPSSIALLLFGACGLLATIRRQVVGGILAILAVGLAGAPSVQALDLIAQTGFNDAAGINADVTPNSPYQSGTSIVGGPGANESGWTTPWEWSFPTTNMGSAAPQSIVTVEGDMALRIDAAGGGGASTFKRSFDTQLPGHMVNFSTRVRVDDYTTGVVSIYLLDSAGLNAAVFTADQDGSVKVVSGANTIEAFAAGSIPLGTWAQMEARANIADQTYTFSLNGVDSGMTYDFRQAAAHISGLQVWSNATLSYLDEIIVSEVPHNTVEQLQLRVDTQSGEMSLVNPFSEGFSLDLYKIEGDNSLVASNWNSLEDQNYDEFGPGPGQGWVQAGGSGNSLLAETFLGTSTLTTGNPVSLGMSYNTALDKRDLVFTYRDPATGALLDGFVNYATGAILDGDYNGNGVVDAADYTVWRDALGSSAALPGDTTAGSVTPADYTVWKSNFGDSGSGSGGAAEVAVPEPQSIALLGLAVVGIVFGTQRKRSPIMLPARAAMVAVTILSLVTSSALAVVAPNRVYTMGDHPDEEENASAGAIVGSSFGSPSDVLDSVDDGTGFNDLARGATEPRYADVGPSGLNRPGAGVGTFGITFDGVDDHLSFAAPLNAPGNAADGFDTQGMQLWVYPTDNTRRQGIVFDGTNVGAIAITADGKWTQSFSAHPNDTDIVPTLSVETNQWHHVMQHVYRTLDEGGPVVDLTTGVSTLLTSVVYVNGIAVSASNDTSVASTGAFLVGAEGDTPANFFAGTLDELEVYTVNSNSFDLFADNDYIAALTAQIPGEILKDGDVNRDGSVNDGDITAFIDGWLREKTFDGAHNDVWAGDWETWGWGDMNHDGRVTLSDAFILHQGLLGEGAGGFDFSLLPTNTAVPEPSAVLLALLAIAALTAVKTKGRKTV